MSIIICNDHWLVFSDPSSARLDTPSCVVWMGGAALSLIAPPPPPFRLYRASPLGGGGLDPSQQSRQQMLERQRVLMEQRNKKKRMTAGVCVCVCACACVVCVCVCVCMHAVLFIIHTHPRTHPSPFLLGMVIANQSVSRPVSSRSSRASSRQSNIEQLPPPTPKEPGWFTEVY